MFVYFFFFFFSSRRRHTRWNCDWSSDVCSSDLHIDALEPAPLKESGAGAVEEIFADISNDRLSAARKILSYLKENPDPKPLVDAARRLIFLKGRDAHDYKFSSAVLEDYNAMAAPWRDRYLAASVFNLKGSGDS